MECLTSTFSFDIFMDNYITYFSLFIQLRVNKIQVTGVKKRNMANLNSAFQNKKQCNFDSAWL